MSCSKVFIPLVAMTLLVAACTSSEASGGSGDGADLAVNVGVALSATEHGAGACWTGFRAMELDHVVNLQRPESAFDANGSGVALGDLDGDNRIDIVLGNLDNTIRVFWNKGDLRFEAESVGSGRARAVQLVDFDADGDLDIVTAPGLAPPLVFVNQLQSDSGPGQGFTATALPGVDAPAYTMLWLDADRDGDLDLVTASYDMEFGRLVGGEYISDAENGVWYYEQDGATWTGSRLAPLSHALAITTFDAEGDGDADLIVGNDYGVPDGIFLWDNGWQESPDLLPVTAANTMSFDIGDLDADGDDDLYATDMAPFDDSNAEFWAGMGEMEHDPPGPQLVENVLIDIGSDGFDNLAAELGLAETGWSWSGRLADLDNDRDLDVFVANGMLPSPLHTDIAGGELVEPNLAYRNLGPADDGAARFERADDWGLDSTASTRGVAVGDLDDDGDLDLVTSTVGSPAQLFINGSCGGTSLIVDPRGVDGQPALGARVDVATASGVQTRTIRSGIGYLSADPATVHFGLGDEPVDWVGVTWPDGEQSRVDAPESGRLTITRTLERVNS